MRLDLPYINRSQPRQVRLKAELALGEFPILSSGAVPSILGK